MRETRPRKTTANRTATLPPVRRRALRATGAQICLGTLVGWDAQGPLVDFDGNPEGPVHARCAATAPPVRPTTPVAQTEVVLLVDPRPGRAPVLLGVLEPIRSDGRVSDLEARVDGRRVELDGRDEIVLRCGQASITLRRNGRILISGVQIETRARGVNRIKGGSVAIN